MGNFSKPLNKIPVIRNSKNYKTVSEMIANSAEQFRNRTAFEIPDDNQIKVFKYSDVFNYVSKFATYLKENGIEFGDKVALLGENRPEWGISFFALSWIGAVAVPLDARASSENFKNILGFSQSKAIILSINFQQIINQLKETLPNLNHIIVMEGIPDICSRYSKGISSVDYDPDHLMEILYTSGTTGDPKGVMLTHKNLMSNVEDIYKIIDLNEEDKAFSILPIHHCYECTGGLLATFYSGINVSYARSLKPREMLEDLKAAKPTIWLNSPLILEKMFQRINKELNAQSGLKSLITNNLPKRIIGNKVKQKLGLQRIRHILSGGAALPDWVGKGLCELGFPIIQGYGLSESSPLISMNPPDYPKNESVGMIIPSVESEIVDIDSEGNGEIIAKGDNIMKGYYNNKTATDEVLTPDGWLKTGDIGYFDEEGYLYITGRKKFVIVTKGGKNVFPEEVEEKLCKSPLIEEAMVFSPDDSEIQALIFPNIQEAKEEIERSGLEYNKENCKNLIHNKIRTINKDLEVYKKVIKFDLRYEEFPKTTTRKIKRHLFKDYKL